MYLGADSIYAINLKRYKKRFTSGFVINQRASKI